MNKTIVIGTIAGVLLVFALFGLFLWQQPQKEEAAEQMVTEEKSEDKSTLREIKIIPIGMVSSENLVLVRQILEQNFSSANVKTYIAEPRDLAQDIFKLGNQYDAAALLQSFEKTNDPAVRLLGVIDEGMSVRGLPFVFSSANPETKSAIISLQRLKADYSGVQLYRYPDGQQESTQVVSLAEQSLTRERYRKVLLRALGLTLGFQSSEDRNCMMAFSNNVYELDRKGVEWCGQEQQIVRELQGVTRGGPPTLTARSYQGDHWRASYPDHWTVQTIGSLAVAFSGKSINYENYAANYEGEEQCKLFYGSDSNRKPSTTWSFQGWIDVPMRETQTEARIYRETTDDVFYLFVSGEGGHLFAGQIYGKSYENCLEVFRSIIGTFERVPEDDEENQAQKVILRFIQARHRDTYNLETIAQFLTEAGMKEFQEVPLTYIDTQNYAIRESKKLASGIYEFYVTIPRIEALSLFGVVDGGYAAGELIEVRKFPDGYYVNSLRVAN
ncbi:MAG: hypothetical protein AAB524_02920 [Patescibacteria group bacterium]